MNPLVIYHADCTDGFGAAFAAWLSLGPAAEYLPMNYINTSPDMMAEKVQGREVYILDFSFSKLVMEHIFNAAECVVWLDHHKTAFEMWCQAGEQQLWEERITHRWITLDNSKSGALLAWEYFHPLEEAPKLIQHIDDRDRWQFKLKGSKELHAALWARRPWSFEQWNTDFMDADGAIDTRANTLSGLYEEGAAILRAQDANVMSMAKQARKCNVRLYNPSHDFEQHAVNGPTTFAGSACNAPLHQSELGHVLATRSGTYGLIWYLAEDNRVKCSLRSNGDYDVSAIAKAFGGGGHRNAAGFETDIQTLLTWL